MMVTEYYMSNKSPEKVSDEDYKVAPTSADKPILNKQKDKSNVQTGENYELPAARESKEEIVQEELN
jgi:hypothetical protein